MDFFEPVTELLKGFGEHRPHLPHEWLVKFRKYGLAAVPSVTHQYLHGSLYKDVDL